MSHSICEMHLPRNTQNFPYVNQITLFSIVTKCGDLTQHILLNYQSNCFPCVTTFLLQRGVLGLWRGSLPFSLQCKVEDCTFYGCSLGSYVPYVHCLYQFAKERVCKRSLLAPVVICLDLRREIRKVAQCLVMESCLAPKI